MTQWPRPTTGCVSVFFVKNEIDLLLSKISLFFTFLKNIYILFKKKFSKLYLKFQGRVLREPMDIEEEELLG